MAIYVLSDVHGMAGAFHRMLDMIGFSDDDILFLIGDLIDRGDHGITLLREVMAMDNVHMLLGNHEYMMLDYFRPGSGEIQARRWARNGNAPTLAEFYALAEGERAEILEFLKSLPDGAAFSYLGTDYFLVHGFPGANTHDAVWSRPRDRETPNPVPGRRLIIGHTPVPFLAAQTDREEDEYFRRMEQEGQHVEILHTPGFIDIDCGCGHSAPGCCLGCLRLDDGMEFYTPGRRDWDD